MASACTLTSCFDFFFFDPVLIYPSTLALCISPVQLNSLAMSEYLLLRFFFIFPVLTYTVRPTIQHPALIRSELSFRTLGEHESLHIRGGFDKHRTSTGKFVVEHRPSKVDLSELNLQNPTISRKASCFPIANLSDLYELEGVLGNKNLIGFV